MSKHVLVFGSYVTDLCGRTNSFPKDGETIKGNYFKMGPGGKGSNQAVAAKRAGADVTFITKLGNDIFGKQALEFYDAEGFSKDSILVNEEEETGVALIIVNEKSAQNKIVVISGASGNFTESDMPKILRSVEQTDILLIQLETNLEPVKAILKHAKNHGVYTILNPAPAQKLEPEYYGCVDIITPNESEAEFLTDIPVNDFEGAAQAAKAFQQYGVKKVIITLGRLGAYACDGNQQKLVKAVECGIPIDTTGAGDAFSGGLVAALARGFDFFDAVKYGSCVAGIAVTKHGTAPAMPYQDEIDKVYTDLCHL